MKVPTDTNTPRWLRSAPVLATFLFFLLKGLAWLAIAAATASPLLGR